MRLARRGALAGLLLLPAAGAAQQRDTVLAAGPQYEKGALYRWLLGSEYRQLWLAPVRVPVLDLRTFAGGARPTTAGGGFQTLSLRFESRRGIQYGFRSVDKRPDLLPPELDGTFLEDIVQDKTSAQHPGAPPVVAGLLEAAGVLHTEPVLVVLPDDASQLDTFRTRFGGIMGYIERRATGDSGDADIFAGATDISNGENFLRRVFRDTRERIDHRAFLKARLMDFLVGDWDRHHDQWRWARFGNARPYRWQPIPEDRDHAFVRFDGILAGIARRTSAPMLQNYGPEYGELAGQAWNGRDLDRYFLGVLERPVWDSVARDLQQRLTDSAIDASVRLMAPEWQALDGARLARALKARRDGLHDYAISFYRWLAREAEVHATAAAENVVLERLDDGRLRVMVAARGEEPWIDRTYDPGETSEVRLYLARPVDPRDTVDLRLYRNGEPDRVVLRGDGPDDIIVRLIRDDATLVLDSARESGLRLYTPVFAPLPSGTEPPPRPLPVPEDSLERPIARDWGHRAAPLVWFGGGPDIGMFLGAGVTRTAFGFRETPFASRWSLRGGWAFGASRGRLGIDGTIREQQSRRRFDVSLLASGIETLRWFGAGNESARQPGRYNYVSTGLVRGTFRWVLPLAARAEIGFGPTVQWLHTRATTGRIIADSTPYGAGDFGVAGASAEIRWDSRDVPRAPTRGLALTAGGNLYPAVWSADSSFADVYGSAQAYLGARSLPFSPVLALRAGAKQVFGAFPYTHAAFIGDAHTVRLGSLNRFAGERAAWGGSELRLAVTRFSFPVPGRLGVFGLAETGRVWADGETSDRWHSAVGGGVWFSLVQPGNVFSVAMAKSADRTALYLAAGFAY